MVSPRLFSIRNFVTHLRYSSSMYSPGRTDGRVQDLPCRTCLYLVPPLTSKPVRRELNRHRLNFCLRDSQRQMGIHADLKINNPHLKRDDVSHKWSCRDMTTLTVQGHVPEVIGFCTNRKRLCEISINDKLS